MSKAVDIFSGILFVRTRHYEEVKKVVVLQGNKPEKRFFEERSRGKWKFDKDGYWHCPYCNRYPYNQIVQENFCPNCGANMREGGEK